MDARRGQPWGAGRPPLYMLQRLPHGRVWRPARALTGVRSGQLPRAAASRGGERAPAHGYGQATNRGGSRLPRLPPPPASPFPCPLRRLRHSALRLRHSAPRACASEVWVGCEWRAEHNHTDLPPPALLTAATSASCPD